MQRIGGEDDDQIQNILRGEAVEYRGMKEKIRKNDKQIQSIQCVEKSPLIAEVAKDIGWSKLWYTCLSFGYISIQLGCRN